MDVELVARNSLSSLYKSGDQHIVSPENLDDWTWTNLRAQFKYKSLERLYLIYRRKLENGYMSLFVVLQLVLSISHCLILIYTMKIKNALIDLIVCGIVNALLFPIVALSFRSKLIMRKSYLPVCLSCLVIGLLVVGDLAVTLYYALSSDNETLSFRPVYTTHTLLACYVFLPLSSNLHAFVLGATASFCYLASYLLITYRNDSDYGTKIPSDIIYHGCVNCLGLYFRFMNEIIIRRSFLDRRKCVESTLRLNYEKDQVEQLTRSVLPPHFAAKIKKNFHDICKFIEEHKPYQEPCINLHVETHENVSILYADVVNFSGLTVTLPVKKLVETLNDLFGSFDEASERHNVLRIKFLGDCYYCVSGVPTPNAGHAKSCVDLGLDMIRIINCVRSKVQKECGVDVNMRIGVHSGRIISGILGTNKWQYDVWSRDVIIANAMEQTGQAGKVHVTRQTLDLLDLENYNVEPVKGNDGILQSYGIHESYLITAATPDLNKAEFAGTTTNANGKTATAVNSTAVTAVAVVAADATLTLNSQHNLRRYGGVYSCNYRKKTHFMNSCLQDYHLMLKAADAEMEQAIEQMPLSKWGQWCRWENMNPVLLTFSRWNWEVQYLREPDPLFKFYVACAAFILLSTLLIILGPILRGRYQRWYLMSVVTNYSVTLTFIFILAPLTWTQFLWSRYKESHDESLLRPRQRIINLLYQTSVKINYNEILRIVLYFIVTGMTTYTAVFNLLMDCAPDIDGKDNITSFSNITEPETTRSICLITSWQATQSCALAIFTSFLFLRINFILKLLTATSIVSFYAWSVWDYRSSLFQQSSGETWNPHLDKRLAHILTIVYLTFTLHLIDRQAEYLNRLDYQWKRQLKKEKDEAIYTRNANKLLLRNILPEHVADFYLNMDRMEENALYHEAHDYVAVMFATLTDLSIDASDMLNDFNEIICQFDKLLFDPYYMGRIEKIKLAGTTYMAACGLETSKQHVQSSNKNDLPTDYNVVKVLIEFAVEMITVLEYMKSRKPYRLRMGISHGQVTAGVVGAQKPHYDIWGDAVNMASRMDTTGEPGKIQVTKETAEVLKEHEISCDLRGETWVKPKGFVTTYFVNIDRVGDILKKKRFIPSD